MQQVVTIDLVMSVVVLAQAISTLNLRPAAFMQQPMGEPQVESTVTMLAGVSRALDPLNTPTTKTAIETTRRYLLSEIKTITWYTNAHMLNNVLQTLANELPTTPLYALRPTVAPFYAPPEPLFGAEVAAKFPSLATEIEHGGKALACGLHTAAVFHWVRCLEAGVRAMTRCLGIPDPTTGAQRNWGNVSKSIQDEIDRRWPPRTGRMSGDGETFDRFLGSLRGMTNPYRNATMHLTASYDEAEALHIHALVKGLMQQIAGRMDEQGLPLA